MTNKRNRYNMDRRLNRLAERILENSGDYPLIFLDTGAIIDFEHETKRARLIDKTVTPTRFYSGLKSRLGHIYVTDHVFEELEPHYNSHRVNGMPEVSEESFEIATKFHGAYCDFLRDITASGLDTGQVRYDTFWASKMAFNQDHKKNWRDPVSRVDREQIAATLSAKYSAVLNDWGREKKVSSAIIISPDEHIHKIIDVLMTPEFGYKGLKTVTSR